MSATQLATNITVRMAEQEGLTGHHLLNDPLLNEGSAFRESERRRLNLLGLLPYHCSTVEEQLTRVYGNYKRKDNDLERYIFLAGLQDRNETLFYRLLSEHITEMMPIIYTPVVGEGCRRYSQRPRSSRQMWTRHRVSP